MISQP